MESVHKQSACCWSCVRLSFFPDGLACGYRFTFTAEMLGLSGEEIRSGGGSVRDLWQHKDMGAFGSSGYKATVGRHDVVAIRVSASAGGGAAA